MINISKVKIELTIPSLYLEEVRNAICNEGAGIIGNYTHCSMTLKCIGTFKPNSNEYKYKERVLKYTKK